MKTITILSRKGGSGKTTLAVNLAVCAQLHGLETLLIDTDPQATASEWGDRRKEHRKDSSPVVIAAPASRLAQNLEKAEESGAQLVIVDTPPHAEQSALEAARVADIAIIPCRASVFDLRAVIPTLDTLRLVGVRGVLVLNSVPYQGSLPDEARKVLETRAAAAKNFGSVQPSPFQVSPVQITQRIAFVHSITDGGTAQEYEPDGKAAKEIQELFHWVMNVYM